MLVYKATNIRCASPSPGWCGCRRPAPAVENPTLKKIGKYGKLEISHVKIMENHVWNGNCDVFFVEYVPADGISSKIVLARCILDRLFSLCATERLIITAIWKYALKLELNKTMLFRDIMIFLNSPAQYGSHILFFITSFLATAWGFASKIQSLGDSSSSESGNLSFFRIFCWRLSLPRGSLFTGQNRFPTRKFGHPCPGIANLNPIIHHDSPKNKIKKTGKTWWTCHNLPIFGKADVFWVFFDEIPVAIESQATDLCHHPGCQPAGAITKRSNMVALGVYPHH